MTDEHVPFPERWAMTLVLDACRTERRRLRCEQGVYLVLALEHEAEGEPELGQRRRKESGDFGLAAAELRAAARWVELTWLAMDRAARAAKNLAQSPENASQTP